MTSRATTNNREPVSGSGRVIRLLSSPWSSFFGALVGAYVGLQQPDLAPFLAPIGQIYLNTLKMCILPILITAISTSLGRNVKSKAGGHMMRRMALVFFSFMLGTSILGTVAGTLGAPGSGLQSGAQQTLGTVINESNAGVELEMAWYGTETVDRFSPLARFIIQMVPDNIFQALSDGQNLQVLLFSILLGLAIGHLPDHFSSTLFALLEGVYQAFCKLVDWLMIILPFGLCGLIAGQFSQLGLKVLYAMISFLVTTWLAFAVLILLSAIVLRWRSGLSFARSTGALREPIIIGLGTWSSLAAIPATLTAMHEGLGFRKSTVNLLIPLGVNACRYGNVLFFAVATLFIAQLYQVHFGPVELALVVVGSVLAGFATAGATGVVTLTMLGLVLAPLGLPLDAVLALFIAIDPMVSPFRVLTNVYTNCAATTVIIDRDQPWDGSNRREAQRSR